MQSSLPKWTTPVFALLLTAAAALSLTGCFKGLDDDRGPGPIIEPPVPTLFIRFVDHQTGENLIRTDGSGLDPEQISLYNIVNDTVDFYHPVPFRVDSADNRLLVSTNWPFMLIQIDDQPGDTLTLKSTNNVTLESQPYPLYLVDTILVNGTKISADDAGTLSIPK